ncbi:MAG: glycosyltransferase family 4 protein [Pseudomonadota bacterium]
MHIVHCGIEPDRYHAREPRSSPPSSSTSPCKLLFVGRLAGVKGVPVLFEALRSLRASTPEIHLTLIGDGPERAALEDKARVMGLQGSVTFAGYQSQAEVAEALSDTDIFVLPSFAEGVPVVLMEALASAVPVITSRIAGVPELVQDKVNGLLVPPGDPRALSDAIQKLAATPDLRKQYGQAGQAKVQEQYNVEHESKWLAHLFMSYLAEAERLPVRPDASEFAPKFTKIPGVIGT